MISTVLKQQIIGWLFLLFFSLSVNSLFANRMQDSLVLVELYNATDGPNWTNTWDLQQPMDTWYGITLTDQGKVRFILLSDNNLVGTIPDLVLPELTSLNLGVNKLEGELPSFGFVPKLEFLNLQNNRLTGTLPAFTNLPKLFGLILDRNQLSGEVTSIQNLPNLSDLFIGFNEFSGAFPDLNSSNPFTVFWINHNQFTSIPDLSKWNWFWTEADAPLSGTGIRVENNRLSFRELLPIQDLGKLYNWRYTQQAVTIPSEAIEVQPSASFTIDLMIDEEIASNEYTWYKDGAVLTTIIGDNSLTISNAQASDAGDYYCIITNPALPDLSISTPIFSVAIPNATCASDSLALVALYNATNGPNWTNTWDLTQPISTWYGVTLNASGCVFRLDLDGRPWSPSCETCSDGGNNLNGTIPSEFWTLSELKELYLASNFNLRFNLDRLHELENLEAIIAFGTNIKGAIPNTIGSLQNLKILELANSQLMGPIPASLNNLTNLETINLFGNQLTALPDLSNLQRLRALIIGGNNLGGTFPEWIFNIPSLGAIDLEASNLTGTIEYDWSRLPNLVTLALSGNNLTGSLPTSLGEMPNLWILRLQFNQFKGTIPASLGNYPLGYIYLHNNQLSGPLPNFSKHQTLNDINIQNNLFIFSDFVDQITTINSTLQNNSPWNHFRYDQQANLTIVNEFTLSENDAIPSITVDLKEWLAQRNTVSTLAPSNTYAWFKDGSFLSIANPQNGQVEFPIQGPATEPNSGIYTLQLINSAAPDLVFTSHQITLKVATADAPTDIFGLYPWLQFIANPDNCNSEKITVYQSGAFAFLLIETADATRLYNETGQLYCTNAPNFDCVAAYNLTELVTEWSCGGATEEPTSENSEEENEPTQETEASTLFTDYPWLHTLLDINNCNGAFITAYQTGPYVYLLVSGASGQVLYNAQGQVYCTNAPNYDCVNAFGLSEVIDSWTCANLGQPSTQSLFKVTTHSSSINEIELQVFPNPASTKLMVELPISVATSSSTFTLLHVNGQVMLTQPVSTPLLELDIMDFPRGIYIAQWKNGNTVYSKRVLFVGN